MLSQHLAYSQQKWREERKERGRHCFERKLIRSFQEEDFKRRATWPKEFPVKDDRFWEKVEKRCKNYVRGRDKGMRGRWHKGMLEGDKRELRVNTQKLTLTLQRQTSSVFPLITTVWSLLYEILNRTRHSFTYKSQFTILFNSANTSSVIVIKTTQIQVLQWKPYPLFLNILFSDIASTDNAMTSKIGCLLFILDLVSTHLN